jgi:cytochrome c oxidase subunit II
MALLRRALVVLMALACASCTGWQSALDPHGAQARGLEGLIWIFIWVAAAVWLSVMVVLAVALRRKSGRRARDETHVLNADGERRMRVTVSGAVTATVVVVLALTVTSFVSTRLVSSEASHPLEIRVTGYQWWWEVTYLDAHADQVFTTANEIHIPVGRAVRLQLRAADVIHSFWAPNLAGKQDLIPGRENNLTFTAQKPGTYRGQCAEFCGIQHAHMALLVIAETPEAFEQWRQSQLSPAASPADPEEAEGQKVFTSKPCASCHTIQGTSASASIGPDLTHVGGRSYIGAGLLPNTRGSLAAWIADPQTLKPGNNMPNVPLTANELRAVSAYLAALK